MDGWCLDCEVEWTEDDVAHGILINGWFDGRCADCLDQLNVEADDMPAFTG